jgi:hypothetical protein
VEAYNKIMQKQEIELLKLLRMIGDSILGETKQERCKCGKETKKGV